MQNMHGMDDRFSPESLASSWEDLEGDHWILRDRGYQKTKTPIDKDGKLVRSKARPRISKEQQLKQIILNKGNDLIERFRLHCQEQNECTFELFASMHTEFLQFCFEIGASSPNVYGEPLKDFTSRLQPIFETYSHHGEADESKTFKQRQTPSRPREMLFNKSSHTTIQDQNQYHNSVHNDCRVYNTTNIHIESIPFFERTVFQEFVMNFTMWTSENMFSEKPRSSDDPKDKRFAVTLMIGIAKVMVEKLDEVFLSEMHPHQQNFIRKWLKSECQKVLAYFVHPDNGMLKQQEVDEFMANLFVKESIGSPQFQPLTALDEETWHTIEMDKLLSALRDLSMTVTPIQIASFIDSITEKVTPKALEDYVSCSIPDIIFIP